jgi:hypothetical protein
MADVGRREMEIAVIKRSLRRAMQKRIEAGLVPDTGRWVARSVLDAKIRENRVKARVHALELMLLYLAFPLISLIVFGTFWYLCY